MLETFKLTMDNSEFLGINPFDIVHGQKFENLHFGPKEVTTEVRQSQPSMRGYLMPMTILSCYPVLDLPRLFA